VGLLQAHAATAGLPGMRPPATQPGDWHLGYIAAQKSRLASNQDEERWLACTSLANHPELAKSLVAELTEQLGDENRGVRYAAARVLQKLGPDAKDAVAVLIQMLGSDDAHDRQVAAMTLGCIGPPARPAVPLLINQLESWDDAQRIGAAWALGRIGDATETHVAPALLRHLTDPDRDVRQAVAGAVETLGPGAANLAIPQLREQLNMTSGIVRMDCAVLLARLTRDRALLVPACISVLRDSKSPIRARVEAARLLGHSGSSDAVGPLVELHGGGPRALQVAIAQALRELAASSNDKTWRRAEEALKTLRTESGREPIQ
jgi:HEAT repeat protein